jgi:DNA polymerase-3 subunit beta
MHKLQLFNAIKFVEFSMPKTDVRYYLNGVCLEFLPKGIRLISTDGHCMAVIDVVAEEGDVTQDLQGSDGIDMSDDRNNQVIIPADKVPQLLALLKTKAREGDQPIKVFQKGPDVVQFTDVADNTTIEITGIDGKYPDYHRIVDDKEMSGERADPIGMQAQYLERAGKACKFVAVKRTGCQVVQMRPMGPNSTMRLEPIVAEYDYVEACAYIMPVRV